MSKIQDWLRVVRTTKRTRRGSVADWPVTWPGKISDYTYGVRRFPELGSEPMVARVTVQKKTGARIRIILGQWLAALTTLAGDKTRHWAGCRAHDTIASLWARE
ncbi:hypothetical protein O181_103436 [Austropuccinia psidii MF-1]|uniref:Uncharacterized protein n=1 Tax=Austropuccinia psidii MF-1 TaxID=1389203 RepID=A0A9Q3PKI2_9BASI|nr:hypothetical protein [Austropuccinia psidii MF-1]